MVSRAQLAIDRFSTGYPGRPVIRDVSLPPLRAGEITALVGPNAAGKSTLLRGLAGLLPASGEVTFDGRSILQLSPRARAELIGFMPQSVPQAAELTVLEGMLSALHVAPRTGDDPFVEQAIDVLGQVGIAHLALEPLNRLSGGQRQLASLAQSIVRYPPILLLDEPTSALDLGHQFDVMNMVRRYVSAGRIAVVVLHDLTFAARWADNIVVMSQGQPKSSGRPFDVVTPDLLADVYRISARIERCSYGYLQLIVDDRVADKGGVRSNRSQT